MAKRKGLHRVPTPKKATPNRIPTPTIPETRNEGYPLLRFQFADTRRFQISKWTAVEKDRLFEFFVKVEKTDWNSIYRTSGGGKTGLGYTKIPIKQLPGQLPPKVSEDVTIFELRVDQGMRVFAFRTGDVCNIIWYDREHVL